MVHAVAVDRAPEERAAGCEREPDAEQVPRNGIDLVRAIRRRVQPALAGGFLSADLARIRAGLPLARPAGRLTVHPVPAAAPADWRDRTLAALAHMRADLANVHG